MRPNMHYRINCGNEWCSGPEHWKTLWEKPEKDTKYKCPTCGWLAWLGNGITAHSEERER